MSQDIRSFFRLTKKTPGSSTDANNGLSVPKKKARVFESSDEDQPKTPTKNVKKESKKRKATARISSDSDSEKKQSKSAKKEKAKKASPPKLKPYSPFEMFGISPSRKDTPKPKLKVEELKEEDVLDEDFIATLKQLDEVILKKSDTNVSPKPLKKEETARKLEKVTTKSDNSKKEENSNSNVETNVVKQKNGATPKPETPKSDPEVLMDTSVIESTPVTKKRKMKTKPSENNDETITDEEKFERRRQSAALYQQYLKRGGPPKPGSKEIPKGKPDCLKGLTFIITGVLESLERDECASIITDLGGRVTKSVSGKVTYMVLGDDAGPAKTEKARSLGVKMLSEDELLNLIRIKSGEKSLNESNPDTNKTESSSKDLANSKTPESKHEKSHKKSKKRKLGEETPDSKPPKSKFLKLIEDTENQEEESPFFKKKISSPEEKPPVKEPTKNDKKESKVSKPDTSKVAEKVESNKNRKEEPKESHTKSDVKRDGPPKVVQVDLKREEIPTENLAWVDKYKPKNVKQIIGQQGDASNAKKLTVWLQNWFKNRDPSKKLVKPSPWAKSDDGAYFKAALLSGPPGVGKTTTATLVCKELGFDTVELNASDSRSKKLLQEDVGHLLTNTSLAGYVKVGEDKLSKKHVLLMDEVDGMAGNEDRGGMQELILLIKKSSIPVICMCNDRNHPKVRSLANYCFDLKFSKPRVEQIRAAMMSVCFKEGIKIKPPILDQIISGTQNDLRQTLNHLALWSKGNMEGDNPSDGKSDGCKKDIKLGPWDVVRKVFTEEEQKKMSIHEKSDLFFNDYSISPLFVQENYLNVTPHANKNEWLDRVAEAADYLSLGDLVEKRIRSAGAWNLLPIQAIYSSVAPGHSMSGHLSAQINFPAWLGKNSKKNKFQRLTSEIQTHTRLCTSGSQLAINLDYLPYIRDTVIRPLQAENIPEAVRAMQDYHLTREDLDALVELSLWPKQKDPLSIINGKTKAAFTRAYNKEVNMVYAGTTSKKKAVNESEEYGVDEEADVAEESEDEDDVTRDNLIKAKKATKVKEEKVSKASSSKESVAKKPTKPRAKKSSK